MKKFFLSFGVLGAFLLYSYHQKTEKSEARATPARQIPIKPQTNANNQATPSTGSASGNNYRDGVYTGDPTDAYYGIVQVKAVVANGKITDVQFLQYPNDQETSAEISSQAIPVLKSEAIQAQSASVDVVSGATQTSGAFQKSLQSALARARV